MTFETLEALMPNHLLLSTVLRPHAATWNLQERGSIFTSEVVTGAVPGRCVLVEVAETVFAQFA